MPQRLSRTRLEPSGQTSHSRFSLTAARMKLARQMEGDTVGGADHPLNRGEEDGSEGGQPSQPHKHPGQAAHGSSCSAAQRGWGSPGTCYSWEGDCNPAHSSCCKGPPSSLESHVGWGLPSPLPTTHRACRQSWESNSFLSPGARGLKPLWVRALLPPTITAAVPASDRPPAFPQGLLGSRGSSQLSGPRGLLPVPAPPASAPTVHTAQRSSSRGGWAPAPGPALAPMSPTGLT